MITEKFKFLEMASDLAKKSKEGWIIHPDYPQIKLAPAQDPAVIPDLQDYMIQADYGKNKFSNFWAKALGAIFSERIN